MSILTRFRGAALVAALLLVSPLSLLAGHRQINRMDPTDPMQVRIYQLDNGLTVYITRNPEQPRFHAEIAVRAGSVQDPAESTGLAHYLEHLLFKGTRNLGTTDFGQEKTHLDHIDELYDRHFRETDPEKRKAIYAEITQETQASARYAIPNEIDKLYKAMGESGLNAHTSHEETVYQVGLPANRLAQWAAIESERFQQPVFRLFQPELEIVYEEKNRSLDNKDDLLFTAVNKQLFKQHPYGQQTTIGEVEHLKNPSLNNIYRYYGRHYVPGNMAICISGDIDLDETIRLIDRDFSVWPAGPVPVPGRWDEAPLAGPERVSVQFQGEPAVMLAFRTPGESDPDADALKLVDMILNNASAGLIDLNLNQAQKVRSAATYLSLNNDYGAEYLTGIPKENQSLEEVEGLLLGQLDLVKRGEFEDWILPAIITDFKKSRKAALERNESRVAWMRSSFIARQDWSYALGEIARLERVTKADVVRAANRYYGTHFVAGWRRDAPHTVPQIEKPALEPIALDPSRQSAFARRILAMPVAELKPVFVKPGKDYTRETLVPGVTLYRSHNTLNDLFVLSLYFDIGARHDPRLDLAGDFLDKCGTTRLSAEDFRKECYKLGTAIALRVGPNETAVQMTGLDENFAPSWALLQELLHQPSADARTLEQFKGIVLVQRDDEKKDVHTLASALSQYNRYGTNSPYLTQLPKAAVEALTLEDLLSRVRGLTRYQHQVAYTGTVKPRALKAVLKPTYRDAGPLTPTPAAVLLRADRPPVDRTYFFQKEMAQAQVLIETGGADFSEALVPGSQLFNDYFSGGMAGIVFQELRETRALAYSANALYALGSRPHEQNLALGNIGCQADKTPEALEAFLKLFNDLPVSPERFADTQSSLLGRYRASRLGFREVLGAVRVWERLGLPIDPRQARYKQISAATLDTVLQFHREQVRDQPRLITFVGDKSKMDWARIANLGPVKECRLDEIFVN